MSVKLKPINEAVAELKASAANQMEYYRKLCEEGLAKNIASLEKNRMVLPELMDVVPIRLWDGATASHLSVNLGTKPPKRDRKGSEEFAGKLVELRKLLGPLKVYSKDVSNQEDAKKRLATVYLECPETPGVSVVYKQKLAKDAKCKIVKSVNYSLACES